jgi:hypothetical protein
LLTTICSLACISKPSVLPADYCSFRPLLYTPVLKVINFKVLENTDKYRDSVCRVNYNAKQHKVTAEIYGSGRNKQARKSEKDKQWQQHVIQLISV